VIVALYVIGSTVAVLLLSARLREAHAELARLREEYGDRAQAVQDEYAAYAHGVALSLACLLAGLAAWYTPPRPASRPSGSGPAGARRRSGRRNSTGDGPVSEGNAALDALGYATGDLNQDGSDAG
jgi:hypothetical protein